MIEAASFVSGFGSTAEFRTSKVGVIHSEDTSPTDVTGGTPSPRITGEKLVPNRCHRTEDDAVGKLGDCERQGMRNGSKEQRGDLE